MDSMFLVTNGNMGGTAGDATLILRRARALYSEKNIFTRIILIDPVKQGNTNTGDYFYSIEVCKERRLLKTLIMMEQPKIVVLYGDKIQMMTKELHDFVINKRLKTKIVLDIQGAVEEKKEYSTNLFRKTIVYTISRLSLKWAVRYADGAFVVSDELADKCKKYLRNGRDSLTFYKVRCGSDRVLSSKEITDNRELFRRRKGINDDTIVFCYSGYRAGWQKVDDIIEHFKRFDSKLSSCFFAFFCNTDEEFEIKLKKAFPKGNYYVELLKPDVYFQCLCGCDVGYILRDYNETNRVAFPNKFSDYITSGLVIAMNNALPEPMRLIKTHEKHYIDTDHFDIDDAVNKVTSRMLSYPDYIRESISICEEELLYTSQVNKLML